MLHPSRRQALEKLLLRLGFTDFSDLDWNLVDQSLIHPSANAQYHNDRLEFLGDSVLRIAITDFLYTVYPAMAPGELSAVRSDLLSDAYLTELADLYGLERFLVVDGGASNDAKGRSRRLADAFEALLGSLYLSWQTRTVPLLRRWLDPHLRHRVQQILQDPTRHNPKAALQELTQRLWGILPDYRLIQTSGGDDAPTFHVEVWIQGESYGQGQGASKKAAEAAAATVAFTALQLSQNLC